ncbi:MAG: hypothetical protein H7289_07745 [Mucilaginibacter sp.]|nr:hypothetical protein [Mucilaginibacter sp.]
MKKYSLTSQNLTGSVVFGYDDNGFLMLYDATPAELNEKQIIAILKNLPRSESELHIIVEKTKCKLELLPEDFTFDTFWDAYKKKINLKRTKPLYEALSDVDKQRAIKSIKPYEDYLTRTKFRGKADADTFLRNRYFETDWSKER